MSIRQRRYVSFTFALNSAVVRLRYSRTHVARFSLGPGTRSRRQGKRREPEIPPRSPEIPADPSLTNITADDAMTGFTESALVKRLMDLNPSQQSIQTLSLWLIHHRKHHPTIVKIWFKEMCKGTIIPSRFTIALFFFPYRWIEKTMLEFDNVVGCISSGDLQTERGLSPRFHEHKNEIFRLYNCTTYNADIEIM